MASQTNPEAVVIPDRAFRPERDGKYILKRYRGEDGRFRWSLWDETGWVAGAFFLPEIDAMIVRLFQDNAKST